MANTINQLNRILDIQLPNEGGVDWSGEPRPVHSIQFHPGAANDILQITAGGLTGPIVFEAEAAAATDFIVKYYHGNIRESLHIDLSDCTLSAGHRVIIIYAD